MNGFNCLKNVINSDKYDVVQFVKYPAQHYCETNVHAMMNIISVRKPDKITNN